MAFIGKNPKFNTNTLTPQSAAPANPVEGMIYYDDGTTNTEGVYKYQNGAFEFIGSLVDHLKLNPLAADPTSPVQGQLFYSDGTSRTEGLWEFNGTVWIRTGSIQNTLNLIPQSADPVSPIEGQLQFADGTVRAAGLWQFLSGAWVQFSASTTTETARWSWEDPTAAALGLNAVSASVGSFAAMPYNTLTGDFGTLDTLTNILTLPAGTYSVVGNQAHFRTNRTLTRLFDITNSTTLLTSNIGIGASPSGDESAVLIIGTITLTSTTEIQIENRAQTAGRLGSTHNFASEPNIFGQLLFTRLS